MISDNQKALLYGLGAVLLWSTVATAFKLTLRTLSPEALVWWASLVSLLVLLGIVVATGRLRTLRDYGRRHTLTALFLGTINPFLYYLILFRAYDRLPAQEAQAINYTWALMLMFLSVPLLGHRLTRRDLLAALLGYLGVLVIATRGDLAGLHFADPIGVGLALLSTVLWAIYWIGMTRLEVDSVVVLTAHFAVGVAAMALWFLWRGNWPDWPSLSGAAGAVYIGLFEMSVTFVLWSRALRLSDRVARISNLIFLSPLFSLGLIHTLLGEPIAPSTLVALALILGGLLIQQIRGKEV